MSASIELSKAAGASGNCASTAWLPTTTRSGWLVMPLAARMICSSSARFIVFENRQPLLGRKDAAEGAGLPKPAGVFVRAGQQVQNPLQRPARENLLPLPQDGRRRGGPLRQPAVQRGSGAPQQRRIGPELGGDLPVQRQAALINPFVRAHMLDRKSTRLN